MKLLHFQFREMESAFTHHLLLIKSIMSAGVHPAVSGREAGMQLDGLPNIYIQITTSANCSKLDLKVGVLQRSTHIPLVVP